MYSLEVDSKSESIKTMKYGDVSELKKNGCRVFGDHNRERDFDKENQFYGKRSSGAASEIGQSKAYLLAMKALQSKLHERDERIRILENQISSQRTNISSDKSYTKERQTANFGNEERGSGLNSKQGVNQLRVEPINLEKTFHNYPAGLETVESTHSDFDLHRNKERRNDCQCQDFDILATKYEESTRELELLHKKLNNCKEQCSQLQDNLDSSNRQVSMLECHVSKKDKEISSLNTALNNMKDLVDIISKKRADCSVDDFDTLESRAAMLTEGGQNQFTLAGPKSCESQGAKKGFGTYNVNGGNEPFSYVSKCGSASFEGIISDVVGHVLLNEELNFEDIDLFACMLDSISSHKKAFSQIEANYNFLKKTKNVLLEQSKVV